jgi:hypothetical protein
MKWFWDKGWEYRGRHGVRAWLRWMGDFPKFFSKEFKPW